MMNQWVFFFVKYFIEKTNLSKRKNLIDWQVPQENIL